MSHSPSGPKNWAGFCAFLRQAGEKDGKDATHLLRAKGEFFNGELVIDCINGFHYEQLDKPDFKIWLGGRVADYFGPDAVLTINRAQKAAPSGPGLKQGLEERPMVKRLMRELNAKHMESGRLDDMD